MNSIQSSKDTSNILNIINTHYAININQMHLHRDMIGYVYIVQNNSKKYVLKLYRPFHSDNALRSIKIIQYLKECDYPVISIVPTCSRDLHISIDTPLGQSIGILFDFVEGTEPILANEITRIGHQVGRLHRLMKEFPEPLISRGKDFYIGRYISLLHGLSYDPRRAADLELYGNELWSRMEGLPGGFCHGDLHSGNMFQTEFNQYVLLDFDVASHTAPIIDAATLSDSTKFNHFDESAYDQTMQRFDRFYQGYSKESVFNDAEIAAIFDFIPIRHYELIATITGCQEQQRLSTDFLDQQYEWLMKWKNLCDRKALWIC